MTLPAILSAAADLLDTDGHWTRGVTARDEEHAACHWDYEGAVCWNVCGAILKAGGDRDTIQEATMLISGIIPLAAWNDHEGRTRDGVVEALRDAAEGARA